MASAYGARALGVVLTGMGQDGLNGARRCVGAGSRVIVQDEETSVVWGMPGLIAKAGLADRVLPLQEIAGENWSGGRPHTGTPVGAQSLRPSV